MRNSQNGWGFILLAASLTLSTAALADVNTVNDGPIVAGGNYFNTSDGKTTFKNSAGGGLWLKSGSNLRGAEVDSSGNLTNNSGTLHFYAPGNVVRLDGNVDVSAIRNQQGAYLGNGGKVFVDSAYLFQNGNIFANGQYGGLVQFNVGGMTLGQGARIEAKGNPWLGGVVAVNSSGPVDLRRGSVITTSGQVADIFEMYNRNLINIEGSLVNNDGALRADGATAGSQGGTIRLVATGQSDLQTLKDTLQSATTGANPTITSQERTFLLQRNAALISNHDGDVVLARDTQQGTFMSAISASGTPGHDDDYNDMTQNILTRAGDGGTIIISAIGDVVNQGTIFANGARGTATEDRGVTRINGGGDGGTIVVTAQGDIHNDRGRLEANGGAGANGSYYGRTGGNGGVLAFSYNGALTNTGGMYANGGLGGSAETPSRGGNGGLVLLSGNANPTGNGSIDVIGRPGGNNSFNQGGFPGYIISPNPGTLGNGQVYFQRGYLSGQLVSNRATLQTQPVELLTHHENLILFTKNGGTDRVPANLFERMLEATYRSLEDPTGVSGQARTEIIGKNSEENRDKNNTNYVYRNLILSSSRDNLEMALSHPCKHELPGVEGAELILPSPLSNGQGFTTLNTLSLLNDGPVSTQNFPGPNDDFPSIPIDMWLIARNSNSLGGGRISILANGDISNSNILGTVGIASGGSVNIATKGTFRNGGGGFGFGGLLRTSGNVHGGSIMAKAGQDIIHNFIHYYSRSSLTANGNLMGGTIRLLPQRDFSYVRTLNDARITANGSLQGGIIEIDVGNNSNIGLNAFEPFTALQANGTSPTQGGGGFIHINAGNTNAHDDAIIDANGGLQNGTVLFTVGE